MRRAAEIIAILAFTILISAFSGENADILFSGNNSLSDNAVDSILSRYGTDGIDSIIGLYANIGFPFTQIFIDSVYEIGNKRILHITIDEGSRYIITGVKNTGNVASDFIVNVTGIEDLLFRTEDINKRLSLLRQYEFIEIEEWGIIPAIESDTSVVLITDINQLRSSSISGVLTFDFDSSAAAGFINADLISPFGYGRTYRLRFYRDAAGLTSLNAAVMMPYLFNSPVGISAGAQYENIDTMTTDASVEGGLTFSAGSFTVQSGLGRTWILSAEEEDNEAFMTAYAGAGYRNNSLGADILYNAGFRNKTYSRITLSAEAGRIFKGISARTEISLSGLFCDTAETYMMMPIGGTENVLGYAEKFAYSYNNAVARLSAGYVFSSNAEAGLFVNGAVYTAVKGYEQYAKLFAFGPYIRLHAGDVRLNLFYGIKGIHDAAQGRIHLSADLMF